MSAEFHCASAKLRWRCCQCCAASDAIGQGRLDVLLGVPHDAESTAQSSMPHMQIGKKNHQSEAAVCSCRSRSRRHAADGAELRCVRVW